MNHTIKDEIEERAAILEFEAKIPRWEAEKLAKKMTLGYYKRNKGVDLRQMRFKWQN